MSVEADVLVVAAQLNLGQEATKEIWEALKVQWLDQEELILKIDNLRVPNVPAGFLVALRHHIRKRLRRTRRSTSHSSDSSDEPRPPRHDKRRDAYRDRQRGIRRGSRTSSETETSSGRSPEGERYGKRNVRTPARGDSSPLNRGSRADRNDMDFKDQSEIAASHAGASMLMRSLHAVRHNESTNSRPTSQQRAEEGREVSRDGSPKHQNTNSRSKSPSPPPRDSPQSNRSNLKDGISPNPYHQRGDSNLTGSPMRPPTNLTGSPMRPAGRGDTNLSASPMRPAGRGDTNLSASPMRPAGRGDTNLSASPMRPTGVGRPANLAPGVSFPTPRPHDFKPRSPAYPKSPKVLKGVKAVPPASPTGRPELEGQRDRMGPLLSPTRAPRRAPRLPISKKCTKNSVCLSCGETFPGEDRCRKCNPSDQSSGAEVVELA